MFISWDWVQCQQILLWKGRNTRVPRNCHYKVTQSPSAQGHSLQLLLNNRASKPAILRVWEGWAMWWGYKSAAGQIKMCLHQCKSCIHLVASCWPLRCKIIQNLMERKRGWDVKTLANRGLNNCLFFGFARSLWFAFLLKAFMEC